MPERANKIKAEDIVRLFYFYDVSLLPVLSEFGQYLGIIKKEALISELSDLANASKLEIDFLLRKILVDFSLDDLLASFSYQDFVVIDIFGQFQGKWSRVKLLSAGSRDEDDLFDDFSGLILEHIPCPLYALNLKGKTIFYNIFFEDLYLKIFGQEVDLLFLENSFKKDICLENKVNEFSQDKEQKKLFFNKDLEMSYEKIVLRRFGKEVGFLIFGQG